MARQRRGLLTICREAQTLKKAPRAHALFLDWRRFVNLDLRDSGRRPPGQCARGAGMVPRPLSPAVDAMDWYLIGRILGVIFWPALAAVAIDGLGRAIAMAHAPQRAAEIRRWSRVAALAGFLVTLIVTGRDLLKYTGGAS